MSVLWMFAEWRSKWLNDSDSHLACLWFVCCTRHPSVVIGVSKYFLLSTVERWQCPHDAILPCMYPGSLLTLNEWRLCYCSRRRLELRYGCHEAQASESWTETWGAGHGHARDGTGRYTRVAGRERVSGKPACSELVLCEQKESIHPGVRQQSKWVT